MSGVTGHGTGPLRWGRPYFQGCYLYGWGGHDEALAHGGGGHGDGWSNRRGEGRYVVS